MKTISFYKARKFLNRDSGLSALIIATVEIEQWKGGAMEEISLQISDCSRIISLSMDINNPKRYRQSLRKCDVLIDTLTAFRSALEPAHERLMKIEKEEKRKKRVKRKSEPEVISRPKA